MLAFPESEVRVLRAMMMRAIALARQVAREGEGREGARGRGGEGRASGRGKIESAREGEEARGRQREGERVREKRRG